MSKKTIGEVDMQMELLKTVEVDSPTISIPTNKYKKYGEVYIVTDELLQELEDLFPSVDIINELHKIKLWNHSNPNKRKTKRGMCRHIMTWMSKAHDRYKPNTYKAVHRMTQKEARGAIAAEKFLSILDDFDE